MCGRLEQRVRCRHAPDETLVVKGSRMRERVEYRHCL
jgi:hypothetical protein